MAKKKMASSSDSNGGGDDPFGIWKTLSFKRANKPIKVRMGMKPPRPDKKVLRLSYFTDPAKLAEAVAALPEEVDYADKAGDSIRRMYKNDTYGDCVVAGKFHKAGLMSAENEVECRVGEDKEVVDQYFRICGPGDNGCVITDVFDEMKRGRFTVGGKPFPIDGYVSIEGSNIDLIKAATFFMGPLTYGIDLPSSWSGSNPIWDTTSSRIVGGHDVCTTGFNKTGTPVSTWGDINTITWAALKTGKWVTQCYAVLAPEWYGGADKLTPAGFDVEFLKHCIELLDQGRIPEIPPAAFVDWRQLV